MTTEQPAFDPSHVPLDSAEGRAISASMKGVIAAGEAFIADRNDDTSLMLELVLMEGEAVLGDAR